MFKEHIKRNMEVYIDDMLVESQKVMDHIHPLNEMFDNQKEILNET